MRTKQVAAAIGSLVIVGVGLQLAAGREARADPRGCGTWGQARVLGGHTFVPLELVSWPFVTTHAGFFVGGGLMHQNATGVDENGNPTAASVGLAALAQGVNLGLGLFDWVALRAQFSGFTVAGSSIADLLGVGAVFNYSVGGGILVRILKRGRFRAGAAVDFLYGRGKAITPGLALATALQTSDLGQAKDNLLADISQWNAQLGLAGVAA